MSLNSLISGKAPHHRVLQSPVSPNLKSQVKPEQHGTSALQASGLKGPLLPHSTQWPMTSALDVPQVPLLQNPP